MKMTDDEILALKEKRLTPEMREQIRLRLEAEREQNKKLLKEENPIWFCEAGGEITPKDLERAYEAGMIRKSVLVHGQYYIGEHRCTTLGRWNAEEDCFYYRNSGHFQGDYYFDTAMHPANDNGYALFVPMTVCEEPEWEIEL